MRSGASIAIISLAALLAFCACQEKADPQVRESLIVGLTDATEIDIASKVAGRITELKVREGDKVASGQELAIIATEEIGAKLDQVNAAIEAANAKLKMAKNGARSEEKEATSKQLEAARYQADLAQKMYDRMKPLREAGSISQAKMDEVEYQRNATQAQAAMAQAKYELVMKGARSEEIEALTALVKQAEGSLSEVKSYDRESSQIAPIDAEVSKIILHKGELAATGYPIMTLVDLSDVWASFALREDKLSKIKKDQVIQVEIPALGKTVSMKVYSIAAMGDFATWRATNDKNSFDLKTFEVKARPEAPIEGLRPGMTARLRLGQ